MSISIDYFYAPISGYAYLGEPQLIVLAERYKCSINFKPIDIARVFAKSETIPPFKQSETRLRYRLHDMQRIANRLGLPINPKPLHWPVSVELAARTIYAAQALQLDLHKLSFAILSAIYAEEKNISDPAVIRDLLVSLDINVSAVESLRDTVEIGDTFNKATEQAIELGVFGSPTYIVNHQEIFFGQDRLIDLDAYLLTLTT